MSEKMTMNNIFSKAKYWRNALPQTMFIGFDVKQKWMRGKEDMN